MGTSLFLERSPSTEVLGLSAPPGAFSGCFHGIGPHSSRRRLGESQPRFCHSELGQLEPQPLELAHENR